MSDIRLMKKIIIQIYNTFQVLWNSKVKFVSLSQLLRCPLFGSKSGLFRVPGFIVSPPPVYVCVCMGPSLICTLPGVFGLMSLWVALTPVGTCGLGVVCTLPPVFRIWAWYPPQPCRSTGQPGGEETGAAASGEFPTVPLRVFFFLRKSSCSILPLHKRRVNYSLHSYLSVLVSGV